MTNRKQFLESERQFIHLLLTGKVNIGEVQSEFPPELFDPHHQPVVASIYEEQRLNKHRLTRERYRQVLREIKLGGDLMANLGVFDACFANYATSDQFGELKVQVREALACRAMHFALEDFRKKAKTDGFAAALRGIHADADRAITLLDSTAKGLNIKTVANVQAEKIAWLWQDRIALGKLSLFVGNPECGKSFASLSLAACITAGLPLPATPGVVNPKGDVLILSSEDGVADTVRPRLEMHGADLDRVHVIEGVAGEDRMFSLLTDLPLLERAVQAYPKTRLIIVDPLNAYLGKTDSYKDADVRRVLSPLCDFADRSRIAVLGIMHLTKASKGTALYRAQGSIAFVAAARAAWLFTKDQDDPDRVLFLQLKNNLAKNPGGLAYRLVYGKGVVWEDGTVDLTADDALRDNHQCPRKDAKEFLQDILKDGAVPSRDIFNRAKSLGIADRTLKRAKEDLHILAQQVVEKNSREWRWSLPAESSNNNHRQDETLEW